MNPIFSDNVDTVRNHLDAGGDPNARLPGGMSWLAFAVNRNNLDIARLLLDRGADVNAVDQNGRSVLFFSRSAEMLRLLFSRGADATRVSHAGETVLHVLGEYSDVSPDMLHLLVERGASLEARDREGRTAEEHLDNMVQARGHTRPWQWSQRLVRKRQHLARLAQRKQRSDLLTRISVIRDASEAGAHGHPVPLFLRERIQKGHGLPKMNVPDQEARRRLDWITRHYQNYRGWFEAGTFPLTEDQKTVSQRALRQQKARWDVRARKNDLEATILLMERRLQDLRRELRDVQETIQKTNKPRRGGGGGGGGGGV